MHDKNHARKKLYQNRQISEGLGALPCSENTQAHRPISTNAANESDRGQPEDLSPSAVRSQLDYSAELVWSVVPSATPGSSGSSAGCTGSRQSKPIP